MIQKAKWRQIAYVLYPIIIGILVPIFLLALFLQEPNAQAGTIRRTTLSQEAPLVVRLAHGRSTAISFSIRPEKVVPGNPEAVEINFLGRDLTLRPLGGNPGNLIVYTKSGRYVILLTLGTSGSYDDVVSVSGMNPRTRPLRIDSDSFRVETAYLTNGTDKKTVEFAVTLKNSDRTMLSSDLPKGFKCKNCVTQFRQAETELSCKTEIHILECEAFTSKVTLKLGDEK